MTYVAGLFYENGGDATRTVLQRGSTGAIVILCSHIKCFSVFKIVFKILRVILRLVLQQIKRTIPYSVGLILFWYDARLLGLLNRHQGLATIGPPARSHLMDVSLTGLWCLEIVCWLGMVDTRPHMNMYPYAPAKSKVWTRVLSELSRKGLLLTSIGMSADWYMWSNTVFTDIQTP